MLFNRHFIQRSLCQNPLNSDFDIKHKIPGHQAFKCIDRNTGKPYFAKKSKDASPPLSSPYIMQCFKRIDEYLVCEWLDGPDLLTATTNLLEDDSEWHITEVIIILRDMLKAVQAVHRAGFVHGDVKPENFVFVDVNGPEELNMKKVNIKLVDFDECRSLQSQTITQRGTLNYFAPELLNTASPSHKSDIWAIGVSAYLLITGESLVSNKLSDEDIIAEISSGRLADKLEAFRHKYSDKIVDLIKAMLNDDPSKRPTATEALSILVSIE